MLRNLRIIFMGTPSFAVASLEAIVKAGFDVVAVVTSPDKPAGRGRNLQGSEVKEAALRLNLPVLQPVKLKDPAFVEELKSYRVNLQVVVAFRMLPEVVWNLPALGTINLHASLLPQYRGAAPINHVIINGETETGLTTFFLAHEIDTGKVILQEKYPLVPDDTAGSLHDKLASAGAALLVKTLNAVKNDSIIPIPQSELISDTAPLKRAPKIFKENCLIRWNKPVREIHNLIRGLSPVPAAFTFIKSSEGEKLNLKIYRTRYVEEPVADLVGSFFTDGRTYLGIRALDGTLLLEEVQLEGKKRMPVSEFLRGFRFNQDWKVIMDEGN